MRPLADSSSEVLEDEPEPERSSSRRSSTEPNRPPLVLPVSGYDPHRARTCYEVETRGQAHMNLALMKDDHRRHMQSLGFSNDIDLFFHSMPSSASRDDPAMPSLVDVASSSRRTRADSRRDERCLFSRKVKKPSSKLPTMNP